MPPTTGVAQVGSRRFGHIVSGVGCGGIGIGSCGIGVSRGNCGISVGRGNRCADYCTGHRRSCDSPAATVVATRAVRIHDNWWVIRAVGRNRRCRYDRRRVKRRTVGAAIVSSPATLGVICSATVRSRSGGSCTRVMSSRITV
jgi:hypothetical protein